MDEARSRPRDETSVRGHVDGWHDLLLDEAGLEDSLERGVGLARRSMTGAPAVSLTVRPPDGSGPQTRAATDERAQTLDEWQYENGEGPCVTADRERRRCVILDLRQDDTFPGFAEVALEHGVHCVVSVPLVAGGQSIGSLNVFHDKPGAADEIQVEVCEQLAATLAPTLANFLTHERTVGLTRQLEEALAGRAVIERAKGLLMARLGVGEQRAFDLLSNQSQHENRKLRDVAEEMVRQHEQSVAPDEG